MSKGELTSVLQSVGGYDALVDPNAKDKDTLALFKYIADEDNHCGRMRCGWCGVSSGLLRW